MPDGSPGAPSRVARSSARSEGTGGAGLARLAPAVIFLFALGVRLAYLAEARGNPFFRALGLDAKYYDDEAMRILSGTLPREPFFMGPLYAYFLALVYAIAGHSYDAVRVIQAVLGSVTALAAGGVAARLAGRTAGTLAALLVAVYPPLIFYSGSILYPTLAALLDTGVVLLLLVHERSGRARDLAAAGILLGASAVGQATVLAFVPAALVWLWLLERRALAAAARRAVPFLVGLAIPIAPIAARNLIAGGEPVLLTTNAGLNFYIGNGPEATGGYVKPKGLDVYEDPSGRGLLSRRLGRAVSAREADRIWMKAGTDPVRADPARFLSLLVRKAVFYAGAVEIPQIENFEFQKRESRLVARLDELPISFGLLGPLSGVGVALLLVRARRREERWRRLLPPLLFVALYSAAIVLFFVVSRYRLPVVPILLAFAAVALVRGAGALRGAARAAAAGVTRAAAASALATAGLFAALSLLVNGNPYRVSERSGFAQCHYRLGIVARQEGRVDAALAEYRSAIDLDPGYAPSRVNLAEILIARGDRSGALAQLREAARIDPKYAKARYNLGVAAAQVGEWDEAAVAFDAARRLAPSEPDSWFGFGAVRFRSGDWTAAGDAFREMSASAAARGEREKAARAEDLARLAAREEALEAAAPGRGPREDARSAALWALVGDAPLAERMLRAAPADDPVRLYQLGALLVASGRGAEGESLLARALVLAPRLPFAHFSLGAARARANDPDGAALEFAREVEVNPTNAQAHFNLGVLALERRGDRAAAAEHFRACAALGGDRAAEAREALRRIGAAPPAGGAPPTVPPPPPSS